MLNAESELMAQARRAVREERLDDAQGFLVNVVVREPLNDEAWLMLAEIVRDPQRKMECLVRARRIDARNPATLRAIQALQTEIAEAAFGQAPTPPPTEALQVPTRPQLAGPVLEYAETIAHALMMSNEPGATRNLGLELVHQVQVAMTYDEIRARRWARSAGRDALVKYEKTVSVFITNLPLNDPLLANLREQRQKALELLSTRKPSD